MSERTVTIRIVRPWRACAYCGTWCRGWTCRWHVDLPSLDTDGRRVKTPAMPTVRQVVEAVFPARGRGA